MVKRDDVDIQQREEAEVPGLHYRRFLLKLTALMHSLSRVQSPVCSICNNMKSKTLISGCGSCKRMFIRKLMLSMFIYGIIPSAFGQMPIIKTTVQLESISYKLFSLGIIRINNKKGIH